MAERTKATALNTVLPEPGFAQPTVLDLRSQAAYQGAIDGGNLWMESCALESP